MSCSCFTMFWYSFSKILCKKIPLTSRPVRLKSKIINVVQICLSIWILLCQTVAAILKDWHFVSTLNTVDLIYDGQQHGVYFICDLWTTLNVAWVILQQQIQSEQVKTTLSLVGLKSESAILNLNHTICQNLKKKQEIFWEKAYQPLQFKIPTFS